MAAPVVATKAESQMNSEVTDHTVTLPASIASGDTVLAFFSCDAIESVGWPGGWNEISEKVSAGNNNTLAIAWRKGTGSEGADMIVTTDTTERSTHVTVRITGAIDPTTQAPEITTVEPGTTGTTIDPPSLTPTGGSQDYLWFAVAGWDAQDGNALVSGPTNYSETNWIENGGTGACAIAVYQRALTAASEDPGIFTITSAEQRLGQTVAVHPAVGAIAVDLPVVSFNLVAGPGLGVAHDLPVVTIQLSAQEMGTGVELPVAILSIVPQVLQAPVKSAVGRRHRAGLFKKKKRRK